jgi:putative transport protein
MEGFANIFLNSPASTQYAMLLTLVFFIISAGYAIGRIGFRGISFGTSGILLTALAAGHWVGQMTSAMQASGADAKLISQSTQLMLNSLGMLEQLGLVLFIAGVGLTAGPGFAANFRQNAKLYAFSASIIVFIDLVICLGIIKYFDIMPDLAFGLFTGALTTTPGLSAAKEAFGANAATGYAIAYPFGVLGVVLFVQVMPVWLKADMPAELRKLQLDIPAGKPKSEAGGKKQFCFEGLGLFPVALAVIGGLLLGSLSLTGTGFEFWGMGAKGGMRIFGLGSTGGTLVISLLLGHMGGIGPVSLAPPKQTLVVLREIGLMLFFTGSGIAGGRNFIETLSRYGFVLFLMGAVMTIVPMIVVFFLINRFLDMALLNTLGSICGGMTSTPALGSLISLCKSDEVVVAYASTYPIALLLIVVSIQAMSAFF